MKLLPKIYHVVCIFFTIRFFQLTEDNKKHQLMGKSNKRNTNIVFV